MGYMPWQLLSSFVLGYSVILIVQCFFCLRVWRISAKSYMNIIVIVVAFIIQCGSLIVFSVHNNDRKRLVDIFDSGTDNSALVTFLGSLLCDFGISISLVYHFYRLRRGATSSKGILQDLVVLSINMGVLLSAAQVITFVFYVVKPFWALGGHFAYSKMYTNSLIATLNYRTHLREVINQPASISLPLTLFVDQSSTNVQLGAPDTKGSSKALILNENNIASLEV